MTGKELINAFVDLPFRLYQDDPFWAPPLRSDVHKLISPKHNPFFAEADIENFVALNESKRVVGRISAIIHRDYNERFGIENAFFGLLELEDDIEIARALLNAVEVWARQRGKTAVSGPYSYTSTQDAALLLENLDGKPPTLLQTYNKPYYRHLLEQSGYELAFTFSTFGGVLAANPVTERARLLATRVRTRNKITVRCASQADLKGNLNEIRQLFNRADSSTKCAEYKSR
jgi:hypothetical protein